MRWHTDRIYTDPVVFAKEAVRNVRAHSSCDIILEHDSSFYTLHVFERSTDIGVELQCNGDTVTSVQMERGSNQVHVCNAGQAPQFKFQQQLLDEIIQQLHLLYQDIK